MTTKAAAIIPAAGSGTRMQSSRPKQYLELAGKPILIHSVAAFCHCDIIDHVIVVVPADCLAETQTLLQKWKLVAKTEVVVGGIRRQDSVRAGLDRIDDSFDIVLVHDGARPLVTAEVIKRCFEEAASSGAAIAAIPVKDTLKRADDSSMITATVQRESLWQAQTPQAARRDLLQQAFVAASDRDVTDEASLLEYAGIGVKIVNGAETNIKITRPEDLILAEKILMPTVLDQIRVGHGFDAHKFAKNRELVLGGVKIAHHLGLAGHSDADVVSHALCDAILGALGRGDIGKHFPDSDAEFKDIYSILLLERVCNTMRQDGYALGNIDITIICQEPKLAPFIHRMKETLAKGCHSSPERFNIKATTTERMGYTGRKEGISCHAVVFLAAICQGKREDGDK